MNKLPNKINKTPRKFLLDDGGRKNETLPVILIVDDHEDSRSMLKTLLEMWKYRVVEAIDGNEALIVAEQTHPDLILMDVKMGKMDGFEVTRNIRRSTTIKTVPIVFLSGCAENASKEKAFAAGGSDYLVKPLDFDELERALAKYIRHPRETVRSNPKPPVKLYGNVCLLQPV